MGLVYRRDGIVVLRGGLQLRLGLSVRAFLVVFGAVAIIHRGPGLVKVAGAIVCVGTLWSAVLWCCTVVKAECDELVIRTPYRTYRPIWPEVARAEVVRRETHFNKGPMAFAVLVVTLHSGRQIRADGTGQPWPWTRVHSSEQRWAKSRSRAADVFQMATEINRRVVGDEMPDDRPTGRGLAT